MMLGIPNMDGLITDVRREMAAFRTELGAIRALLEKLVEIEEKK